MSRSKQISLARLSGLASRLLRWYDGQRRDLPWRPPPGKRLLPDPYAVLVSEFMLQQTQVATVVPYFGRFLVKFPTIRSLAGASEHDVLRLWQGLGYYSRARNLLAAARKVVSDFGGEVPRLPEQLRSLPGVGPYTAGAIASIAFDCRAPILDGNVSRVLCRIEKIAGDPRRPHTAKRLWQIAEGILPRRRCGDFNSALMEIGAVICTPRQPACKRCPVRGLCKAKAADVQDKIPPPRQARPVPLEKRWTICVRRGDQYLIERRPSRGRWAGLWQFPTINANGLQPSAGAIANHIGLTLDRLTRIGEIRHALTHRRYEFTAFTAIADGQTLPSQPESSPDQRWVRLDNLDEYPLSRPQIRISQMLLNSRA